MINSPWTRRLLFAVLSLLPVGAAVWFMRRRAAAESRHTGNSVRRHEEFQQASGTHQLTGPVAVTTPVQEPVATELFSPVLATSSPLPIAIETATVTVNPGGDTASTTVLFEPASFSAQIRRIAGWSLTLAALILMSLSAWNFRWTPGQGWVWPEDGVRYLLFGAVVFTAAVWLLRPPSPAHEIGRSAFQAVPVRWAAVVMGALMIFAVAEISGQILIASLEVPTHIQVALLVAGSLLVGYGLGGFEGIRLRALLNRWSLLLLLITLVALLTRSWAIGGALHKMIDEMPFFTSLLDLWNKPAQRLIEPIDYSVSFPYTYTYVEQFTAAIFGRDLGGVRMAAAFFGALTVPAVYLLARNLTDRALGLMAAVLLAVFPAHIGMSRLALNNIADPLFGTLAVAFLVKALRFNRQQDYVLAGLMLGWTTYFYEGGRLLFAGLFVIWVLFVLVVRRVRIPRRGLVMLVLTALLTAVPYYYFGAAHLQSLTPRLTFQSRITDLRNALQTQSPLEVLASHYHAAILPAFFHTIYSPDGSSGSATYYGGATPIVLWFLLPFYFLGLFYLLHRMKSVGILVWMWIGFGLLGISLIYEVNYTVRFVSLMPIMAVVIAIGMRYPLEMLWSPRLDRRWLTAALVVAVVGIGVVEVRYYFGDHLQLQNRQIRSDALDFYDVFDRASSIDHVSRLIFVSNQFVGNSVLDAMKGLEGKSLDYDTWDIADDYRARLAGLPRDTAYAFAINQDDPDTLAAIRSVFPVTEGPWSTYDSVPRDRQYALFIYDPKS